MGISAMTAETATAYAAAPVKNEAPVESKVENKMTVVEFRNMLNPITKYYDAWSIDSFMQDKDIPVKTKIEVMFGKYIASFIDEEDASKILMSNEEGE